MTDTTFLLSTPPPFKGDTNAAILSAVLRDTPVSVTELRPDLPSELARIVRRCLEKDPARRPQTALDLRNDLEDLKRDSGSHVMLPTTTAARRYRPAFVAAASLLLLAAAGFLTWRARLANTPTIDPKRVVVAVLENRTGDPSLGPLGQMASEALVQGIRDTGVADVVPTPVAFEEAGILASKYRAGTAITGAYYLEGDDLRFQPSIVDAHRGQLLFALDSVRGPRQAPGAPIEAMRQRVMGAIAVHLGPEWFFPHARPPVYAAFREMAAGLEMFGKHYAQAERHFQRAIELDPDYFWPAFHLGFIYFSQGRYEEAEAVAKEMVAIRNRYSPFERLWLEWLQSTMANRPQESLRVLRQAEELEPKNIVVKHNLGALSMAINHPREAVEILSGTDFSLGDRYGFSHWYHRELAAAHHILGDFTAELAVAKRTRDKSPEELSVRAAEARALAALGHFDELEHAIGEALTLPSDDSGNGEIFLDEVALELRAHGRHEAASAVARRGVAWWRERSAGTSSPGVRRSLGRSLYLAEEWDKANAVFRELSRSDPGDVQAIAMPLRSPRGRGTAPMHFGAPRSCARSSVPTCWGPTRFGARESPLNSARRNGP